MEGSTGRKIAIGATTIAIGALASGLLLLAVNRYVFKRPVLKTPVGPPGPKLETAGYRRRRLKPRMRKVSVL